MPGDSVPTAGNDSGLGVVKFDENGLGDHGADSARTPESGKHSDNMDEKNDEAARFCMVTKIANAMDCGVG